MTEPPGIGSALLFCLVCVVYISAAVYLALQVMSHELDSWVAVVIYTPLMFCWAGIGLTLSGPDTWIAELLGVLSVAWCALVRFQGDTIGRKLDRQLTDEKIQHYLQILSKDPNDSEIRFKLGELYEDRGWRREAYQEYAASAALAPHNRRAASRARQLYEQITRKPMPGAGVPGGGMPTPKAPVIAGIAEGQSSNEPGRVGQIKAAIQSEPGNSRLYGALAEELTTQGRTKEAIEAFQAALAMDPSNDMYRSNLHALLQTRS